MALRGFRFLLVLLGLVLAGCASDTPRLLSVTQVTPNAVEVGDEWAIAGEGFVERAPASIVFEGSISRPGLEPAKVTVETSAHATSQSVLTIPLNAALVSAFLGSNDVRHATFRGSVSVAFAPRLAGAPPITGVLESVVLDVFRGDPTPLPDSPSLKLIARFGWQLEPNAEGEMCIQSVNPSATPSPLVMGDCVLRFGELNVFGLQDFAVPAFVHELPVTIKRDGTLEPRVVSLGIEGLQAPEPERWRWALAFVAITAIVVLGCKSPLSAAFALLEAKLGRRSKHRRARGQRHFGFGSFLLVSTAFAACRVGLLKSGRDFDVLLLYGGSLPLLWLGSVVSVGSERRWSFGSMFSSLLANSALTLTTAAALGMAVLNNASLSLSDASLAQGAGPLRYLIFSSPGAYLTGLALLSSAALVLVGEARTPRAQSSAGTRLRVHLGRALWEAHAWIVLGLFVALYAGGWQWPSAWHAATPLKELGVFQLKFSVLYLSFVWLRFSLGPITRIGIQPVFLRWTLPLATAGAVLHLFWSASEWPSWLSAATTLALASGTSLLVLLLVLRLRGERNEAALASVNPWL